MEVWKEEKDKEVDCHALDLSTLDRTQNVSNLNRGLEIHQVCRDKLLGYLWVNMFCSFLNHSRCIMYILPRQLCFAVWLFFFSGFDDYDNDVMDNTQS